MSTPWQWCVAIPLLRSENSDFVSDPNRLVVGSQVGKRLAAISLAFRFPRLCLGLHHGWDFIEMPRAKLVGINANITGERQRLVR